MIYKIEQFIDDKGKEVIKKTPQSDGEEVSYVGAFIVSFPSFPGEPNGEIQIQFEFPRGYSIERCFEEFENFVECEYKSIVEDMKADPLMRNPTLKVPLSGSIG